MRLYELILLVLVLCGMTLQSSLAQENTEKDEDGWISLFNGKNLDGWKVGENASTFSVVDGAIKIDGPRAHLYYVGEVENHDFKNFEFKAKVMTREKANSGIYFHTRYKEDGWPLHGFEVQVNNSHSDWKRSGSLYDIVEVMENYVQDDEWYTTYIKVEGKRVIIKLNDIVVVDYTQPENPKREGERVYRVIDSGTFALQAHDPNSVIYFKDIKVKPLP